MTLRRYINNPILTREDIPDIPPRVVNASSVFNPGAVYHAERFKLLLRVQTRGRRSHLLMAESRDGIRFRVSDHLVELRGLDQVPGVVHHVYDPRITRIDHVYYVMVAMDTDGGCRLGVVRTEDFETFDFLGMTSSTGGPGQGGRGVKGHAGSRGDGIGGGGQSSSADVRNGVLFPEKFGGQFLRLERPNTIQLRGGPPTGRQIVLAESSDLLRWRPVATVMAGRDRYWDELIGSGPPPIKTHAGWLHIYHGIATHFGSINIYQAGAVLLDLDDPSRVLARTRDNVLEPRELYELVGQVPNVVFPSGLIVKGWDGEGFAEPDSKIYLYYGAADTCVGLANCRLADLIGACQG